MSQYTTLKARNEQGNRTRESLSMVDACSTGRGACNAGMGISWNERRR